MRDIVIQRVQRNPAPTPVIVEEQVSVEPTPQAPVTPIEVAPVPTRAQSTLQRTEHLVATISSWANRALAGSQRMSIVRQARNRPERSTSRAAVTIGRSPLRPSLRTLRFTSPKPNISAVITVANHHRSRATQSTKQWFSSPFVRGGFAQAAFTLLLFAFVLTTQGEGFSLASRDSGTALTVGANAVRQYLPTAGNFVEPKAFEETLASIPASSTALHAWATPWNLEGITQNSTQYSSVSAFWLTANSDGSTFTPKAEWGSWKALREKLNTGTKTFVTVTGDPDHTYLALSDPTIRAQHIANLLSITAEQQFDGVDIDFEALGRENRDLFSSYIKDLTTSFHRQGKEVVVTVEMRRTVSEIPMDLQALGATADEVRIMLYDYHARQTAVPGPISPIGWVKEMVEYAEKNIPSEKLVVGLGNYGYDWTQQDDGSWVGKGVSYEQAMALATKYNTPVIRDTGIDNGGYDKGSIPTITYTDEDGNIHIISFEDQASLNAKLQLVNQYRTGGVIFWSVGIGDTRLWDNV